MRGGWIAVVALVLSLPGFGQSSGGRENPSTQATKAPAQVQEVSVTQLKDWLAGGRALKLIDVREDNEWQAGHAAAATHIALGNISGELGAAVPRKTALVVLYCQGGVRSAAGAQTAMKMGYSNVFSLTGGFKQYQLAGLPVQQ